MTFLHPHASIATLIAAEAVALVAIVVALR